MLLTIVLAADAALDAGSVASHHNRQWVLSSTAQPKPQIPSHPYDGTLPSYAGLTLSSDGTILYGTTMFGGDNNKGTVFALGGALHYQLLHQFTVGFPDDGSAPQAGLVLSADGQTLYGTTSAGDNHDNGTVFAVSTSGDNVFYRVLNRFGGAANDDGSQPLANLILSSDGTTLYGTTGHGGAPYTLFDGSVILIPGNGTVFALSTAGLDYKLLHTFIDFSHSGGGADGFAPFAGLVLSGQWLYGTTFAGSPITSGSVFAVNTNGDGSDDESWPPPAYSILHSFTGIPGVSAGNDGANPPQSASLAYVNASPHPRMYGTTATGGDNGIGTLFVLTQVTPPSMQVRNKPHSGVQAAAVEVAYDDPTLTFILESALAPSGP